MRTSAHTSTHVCAPQVTVFGTNFGPDRTPVGYIGSTSCFSNVWTSGTTAICAAPAGSNMRYPGMEVPLADGKSELKIQQLRVYYNPSPGAAVVRVLEKFCNDYAAAAVAGQTDDQKSWLGLWSSSPGRGNDLYWEGPVGTEARVGFTAIQKQAPFSVTGIAKACISHAPRHTSIRMLRMSKRV